MADETNLTKGESKDMNRKIKDSVFTDYFSTPEHQLELYKVLHPEDSSASVGDFSTVTLKTILAGGIYNDLSFTVRDRLMVLTEAQSTWSINIIIRLLMYLGEILHRYTSLRHDDIYGSKKLTIPQMEFYVIYTGTDKQEVKEFYSLADEFFGGKKDFIDLKVKVLKANEKANDVVTQYILFTQVLADQIKIFGPDHKIDAVKATIEICINRNVLRKYLENRRSEVITIMTSLFEQEEITKNHEFLGIVKAAVDAYKDVGLSEKEIVKKIMDKYGVSEEYVLNILHPAA